MENIEDFFTSLRESAKDFTPEQKNRLEVEIEEIRFLVDRGSISLEDIQDESEEILDRAITGEE